MKTQKSSAALLAAVVAAFISSPVAAFEDGGWQWGTGDGDSSGGSSNGSGGSLFEIAEILDGSISVDVPNDLMSSGNSGSIVDVEMPDIMVDGLLEDVPDGSGYTEVYEQTLNGVNSEINFSPSGPTGPNISVPAVAVEVDIPFN